MARDFPRDDAPDGVLSNIIVAPKEGVVAQLPRILDSRTRRIEHRLAFRARDPAGPREAPRLRSRRSGRGSRVGHVARAIMFDRMIQAMKDFFTVVGLVTLSLGGLGVMNIMLVSVRERTREIGIRKALGATTGQIQRQFFLEGFVLTLLSGVIGFVVALGLYALVNLAPMPTRFEGMTLTGRQAPARSPRSCSSG